MTRANVIEFEPRRKPEAAVIADTDNGYTRTANDIQDRLCQLDISGSQFQVLNAIIRTTYGYNKKSDRVTNTFIVELTGLSEKAVRDALIALADRQIITCEKSGIMKIVAVNTTVSDWVIKSDKAANMRKGTEQMHRSKCTNKMEQMHQPKTEQMHRTDGANAPSSWSKCTNTKDNLQKTTNKRQKHIAPEAEPSVPDKLDFACWPTPPSPDVYRDWKKMRTAKKAPVTQTVLNRLAPEIHLAHQAGMSVDDVLAECANRGWTGFKFSWLTVIQRQPKFPQNLTGQNYEGGPL